LYGILYLFAALTIPLAMNWSSWSFGSYMSD
jgi:hypothetical protein